MKPRMKVCHHAWSTKPSFQSKPSMFRSIIIQLGLICIGILTTIGTIFLLGPIKKTESSELTFEEKATALGFDRSWPKDVIERHIWISENAESAYKHPLYTPVHIMYRSNDVSPWKFNGSGTILNKRPKYMVTARHVFERGSGQFGIRPVGTNEFSPFSQIIPIIRYNDGTNSDDSILCQFDPTMTNYPHISALGPTNRFVFTPEFDSWTFKAQLATSTKIHLLTYPREQDVQGAVWVEVRPGLYHLYFQSSPVNGESGTGAIIEGEDVDRLLVIIQQHGFKNDAFDENVRQKIGWHPNRIYGVGVIIKVD